MGKAFIDSRPTPSCRLDWLSLSYYAASEELQERQIGYFLELLRVFVESPTLKDGAGRKFFENSVFHDAGLALKWSSPDGSRNPGCLTVDFKGEIFKLMSPAQRAAVYLDAAELEGFKHCTRLDAQRTLIEPQADAEEIHRLVRERKVWVARHSSYSQLGKVDSKGDAVKGASITWGGPESATRCMTYNKALEDQWDCIAVRHEARLRRQPARDYFARLLESLRAEEGPECRDFAEPTFVQSVLSKHMTYLDTSRLARTLDKKDWPENWVRDSEPAPFWAEVVQGVPMELQATWQQEKALEDSVAALSKQYGRKAALWVMWRVYSGAEDRYVALDLLFSQWAVRLRDEDLDELLKLIPDENRDRLIAEFATWRAVGAHNVELTHRETPTG